MNSTILTAPIGSAHSATQPSLNGRSGLYRTYLLFGAPGSGKGTQGKTLGTIPRYYHCACGDVFRSIDTRTKVGKAFLEYSSKGQLVPDDITVELWREAIDAAVEAHKFKPDIDTLVLDGIPRNVGQAQIMNDMIDVKKVFHLACPDRETLFTGSRSAL